MRHRLLLLLWLVIAWVALWRDVTVANAVSGLLVACLVVWLFPPSQEAPVGVRPLALVRFVLASAISIVRANLVVAWEVVTPSNRINEGVVAVELATNNPVVITLVTHAIILAPGTMVIDVDRGEDGLPTVLYVHVLRLRSVEEVRRNVLELEAMALASVSGRDEPAPPDVGGGGDR